MSIDRYMAEVVSCLRLPPARVAEVTEELRGHLEDAVRELQLAGVPRLESEREAIRRFGPASDVAAAFVVEGRLHHLASLTRHPRALLAAAALATSMVALGGAAVATAQSTHPTKSHSASTVVHNLAPDSMHRHAR